MSSPHHGPERRHQLGGRAGVAQRVEVDEKLKVSVRLGGPRLNRRDVHVVPESEKKEKTKKKPARERQASSGMLAIPPLEYASFKAAQNSLPEILQHLVQRAWLVRELHEDRGALVPVVDGGAKGYLLQTTAHAGVQRKHNVSRRVHRGRCGMDAIASRALTWLA